jgi:hypothetical protein
MVAKLLASATAGLTALCLFVAVVNVSRLPVTRTEAIDLGYQYSDPQAKGVIEQAKALPHFGEQGTNKAFLNMGDGEGQSTKDRAQFQQLAVKQAKKAKKAHGLWKPLAADKLFHFKGVHFKGFNKHKALMLHKLKEQAKAQMQMKHYAEPTAARRLWPGSVIGKPQAGMKSGRPVWNSDMDSFGTMGTNGVFLGSHEGGDSSFTHQPQAPPRAASQSHYSSQSTGSTAGKQTVSPYMTVFHKAGPHMLHMQPQAQQKKQLWPSSVIGGPPVGRVHPPITAADGSWVPGARRRPFQGLAFKGRGSQQGPATLYIAGTNTPYARPKPWITAADGSMVPGQ